MPLVPASPPRRSDRSRGPLHLLIALVLALGSVLVVPLPAYAEDPGFLTIDKTVSGFEAGETVEPGDTFVYTLTITCSNIGSGGCTSAQLTDSLPEGISLNDGPEDITIGGATGTASAEGNVITIDFTEPLEDPVGGQGLPDQAVVTVQIPVVVDEDISPDLDGEDLVNTATVDGSNTQPAQDSFIVVPDIPIDLDATTDKSFDPSSAVANPGTETTMTLSGGNADTSNVAADEIVITDPNDPPGPPGAFEYLAVTGDFDVTLPDGAEQVQVDCYVDGDWVDGTPGTEATLPGSVDDPADCEGIRVHFISTDGANIEPGSSGSIAVTLEQRDNIEDAGEGAITNEVTTTAANGDTTSDPVTADDDYTVVSSDIDLTANKSFDPATIAAGSDSIVTIGATNTSDLTLDSMTITEPGADPNMFTGDNPVTFDGWGDVQWPEGATGATVTFTYPNPPSPVTVSADGPDTLPDPTPGRTVTGFTVEFTGPIVPGAEASIPFTVTADPDQTVDSLDHPNTVDADSTAPGGYEGDATADATLTTLSKRLAIDTGKTVLPSQIFGIPGQQVLVELSGRVEDFPASTTDANDIVVTDPADFAGDEWYDYFAPTGVVDAPIPAGATLTVQYWDGDEWVDVPGMVDLAGPQVFSGTFPDPIPDEAQGIRFEYHSDDGFPPGTEVNPNIGFELKAPAPTAPITVDDCASSGAASDDPSVDPAEGDPACDDIEIVPPTPGNGDFIDKAWDDPAAVAERSQQEKGATIAWSTDGATGIDQMVISDTPDTPGPSQASLPSSVYDSFNLVRIDEITNAMDPRLQYDQILSVQLYSIAAGGWIDAPGDPCPAACDKTFPGYTLSAESQADTIAFRLTYAESPNRVEDNATAPPIGSGVAVSINNQRQVHPVFQIRDDLRSNPDVPVLAADEYNIDGQTGVVRNTAQARLVVDDDDDYYHQNASDDIAITPVNVTTSITKDWTGGPLGVPVPGTAEFPAEYPTATVALQGTNTTPSKVDTLTITDATGDTDPFENFNLVGFTGITDPATIGATGLVITLNLDGGGTRQLTRDQALAAAESDLADVVGFSFAYSGRINAGAEADITFVTRVRDFTRSSNGATPVETPQTVPNEATVEVQDLVNYPGVTPREIDDSDDASIDLDPAGIGLEVTKTFDPDEQTEPNRDPVNMTLTGQPSGPSRTVEMTITDEDVTFFNAYDFVDFGPFAFTAPINQVQVDAYVGGTFTAAGNNVVRTGGDWVNGEPRTTLTLPDGVTADEVQGLRFTFTKADGSIWENPSTPTQTVVLQVQRREELRSGGPVRSDLATNQPNPGEDALGISSDTIQGQNWAADTINGERITADDDAEDDILYRHANNAVRVTKTPEGSRAPGTDIDYKLTFTNTGAVPILNPVITDSWESDGDGPLLVYNPDRETADTGYDYALTGDADPETGRQLPTGTDPTDVSVTETASSIEFRFPADTVLEIGQTYTITAPLQFRSGLAGDTPVTNTTGIIGDRPWDGCEETLDDETRECQASTTVYPTNAGALRGVKSVRAADGDGLGVLDTRGIGDCAEAEEFNVGGCVPITRPDGDNIWRMTFTNTGNLPLDRLYAIDRLPTPGDTGAYIPEDRDSQWTPTPTLLTYAGDDGGTVSQVRLYYTTVTGDDLCTADLDTAEGCPDGAWTPVPDGTINDPTIGGEIEIPAGATAIQFQADFAADGLFQPNGTLSVDITTTAPALNPTDDDGNRLSNPIAWNTVAVAAESNDGGTTTLVPKSEGNKVGATLATGPLGVRKIVTGPAAEYAPDSFAMTVACTSAGVPVDLGEDANITVTPPTVTRIENLPWGSECTVTETGDTGATDTTTGTATVGLDTDPLAVARVTNTYPDASLAIAKDVSGSAVDQDGNPIIYGPFTFDISCTFLGQPVYAAGYSADDPMTATFDSDDPPVVFDELPAGSQCTATESDDGGASTTTSSGTTGAGTDDQETVDGEGDTIDLVLTPDGDDPVVTNTVTFTNTFATGSVVITKDVTGPGADADEVGPFTVHLTCVDTNDPDRTVYDADHQLTTADLTWTVERLYVDATCEVTEPATGGATASTISPEGTFPVTADSAATPVQVTVTNVFDVGSLRLIKKVDGDVADETAFTFQLTCEQLIDGEVVPVDLDDGGVVTLSEASGLTAEFAGLPTGAVCTVTETDNGGADDSVVAPGQVIIGDDTTVDVLATNTFDPPPDEPDTDYDTEGSLPNTGGPSLLFLTIGMVLLVAGGGALVISRRRRS